MTYVVSAVGRVSASSASLNQQNDNYNYTLYTVSQKTDNHNQGGNCIKSWADCQNSFTAGKFPRQSSNMLKCGRKYYMRFIENVFNYLLRGVRILKTD